MTARAGGGLPIRGVFDRMQVNQSWASSHCLEAAGVDIHFATGGQRLGKLHFRLMVIDDRLVACGSFNYTGPANRINDENILANGDLDEDDAQNGLSQTTLATAVRQENDRITDTHYR